MSYTVSKSAKIEDPYRKARGLRRVLSVVVFVDTYTKCGLGTDGAPHDEVGLQQLAFLPALSTKTLIRQVISQTFGGR